MNRSLFGFVAVALLLAAAAPASAATKQHEKATAATCEDLSGQVEQELSANPTAAKVDLAKKQQAAGDKACKAGKYEEGAKHYRLALQDISGKDKHK